MRGGRGSHWVLFVLAVAVAGALIWNLMRASQPLAPAKRFEDGSTVTVLKVAYGKTVKIPLGDFWQRTAVQILPSKLSIRLGLKLAAFTNSTDSVLIVIENFRTNSTFSGGRAMPFNFANTIIASDDAGNNYQLAPYMQLSKASNDVIEVFVAPLVSHVATNINLQLTQTRWIQQFTNYSAEFDIRNPAPRRKPHWTASHAPVTNQMDDLTVIFQGVEPAAPTMSGIGGKSLSIPESSPVFRVFEHGEPSTNWDLASFYAHDEEGNFSDSHTHFSPREPRKFQLELLHTFPAQSDTYLAFRDIAFGDQNQDLIPVEKNFCGHNIRISRFLPGQITYEISPPLAHLAGRFTITYKDENGHTFTALKDQGVGPSGGNMGFSYRGTNRIMSGDITFTFARTTNRFVEFLAYPEPARTNSVPK